MTLRAVQETTKWPDGMPNHAYLLDGDKILAYKPTDGEVIYLSGKMRIYTRGRTFQPIPARSNPFRKVPAKATTIQVQGSKGATYYLNPDARTCTCPGFTYRGSCKHLSLLP